MQQKEQHFLSSEYHHQRSVRQVTSIPLLAVIRPTESIFVTSSYVKSPPIVTFPEILMSPSPFKILPAGSIAPSLSSIGPVPDSSTILDTALVLISGDENSPSVAVPQYHPQYCHLTNINSYQE